MESVATVLNSIKVWVYGINSQYVGYVVIAFMFIIIGIFGILTNNMMKSEEVNAKTTALADISKQMLTNSMKKSLIKAFNYNELELYINRTGLKYMTNEKLTPLTYTIFKIVFAILFMIIGFQNSILLGLLLPLVGYFMLDIIADISNRSDNVNMLEDIKNVYDVLRIQTKAGVYIASIITDCYLVVQNKRLKKAFLRLTSNIAAKNDIETSLDEFRNRFDNEYINTLVVVIKQSMETGQAAKSFDDIRAQITDIEVAMIEAEKNRIRTMIIVCQVLLYVSIIAVSLFVAVQALSSGIKF